MRIIDVKEIDRAAARRGVSYTRLCEIAGVHPRVRSKIRRGQPVQDGAALKLDKAIAALPELENIS